MPGSRCRSLSLSPPRTSGVMSCSPGPLMALASLGFHEARINKSYPLGRRELNLLVTPQKVMRRRFKTWQRGQTSATVRPELERLAGRPVRSSRHRRQRRATPEIGSASCFIRRPVADRCCRCHPWLTKSTEPVGGHHVVNPLIGESSSSSLDLLHLAPVPLARGPVADLLLVGAANAEDLPGGVPVDAIVAARSQ
jgi:hypothetical protein